MDAELATQRVVLEQSALPRSLGALDPNLLHLLNQNLHLKFPQLAHLHINSFSRSIVFKQGCAWESLGVFKKTGWLIGLTVRDPNFIVVGFISVSVFKAPQVVAICS